MKSPAVQIVCVQQHKTVDCGLPLLWHMLLTMIMVETLPKQYLIKGEREASVARQLCGKKVLTSVASYNTTVMQISHLWNSCNILDSPTCTCI